MKRQKISLLTPLFFLLFISRKPDNPNDPAAKSHKTPPPGTVWLKDNLFIDMGPVRNFDYLEFLNFSKTVNWEKCFGSENKIPAFGLKWDSSTVLFRECPSDPFFLKQFELYDSTIEIYSADATKKTVVNPFRHPEYKDYPVVNISFEQAVKFCAWRSGMVMYNMAINSKTEKARYKKYYRKVTYRLPTKEEWELAVTKFSTTTKIAKPGFIEGKPMTQKNNKPNKFYFKPYSITEMQSIKGKCEGLSFKDFTLTDIFTLQNYDGPQTWVGFRCVCEVEE